MAAAPHGARGRAERRHRARRRPRLLRPRVLRLRGPDAAPRPARRRGPALHELPRHADVLADAGGAADRAQLPRRRRGLGGARRPRLPGLRDGTRRERPDDGRTAPRCRLRHDDGRQVAPLEGHRAVALPADALVARATRLRPLLRLPRAVHEPAHAQRADGGQPPHRDRPLSRRLLLHRRRDRAGDPDDPRAEGREPAPAVLPLLRARRAPRAAARQAGRHREVPRGLRRRLGPRARGPLPAAARTRRDPGGDRAGAPEPGAWPRRASVGRTLGARADPVRPLRGALRGDGRHQRPELRPADGGARTAG